MSLARFFLRGLRAVAEFPAAPGKKCHLAGGSWKSTSNALCGCTTQLFIRAHPVGTQGCLQQDVWEMLVLLASVLTEFVPFQAQSLARSLQAELEKLRLAEHAAASDKEEVQHLKERLEKEKKLTKDLGQAATKLQELLKVTQDQLAKEREMVKKLKEQLQETGKEDSSKEGTSV